eukprot:gene51150-68474_t
MACHDVDLILPQFVAASIVIVANNRSCDRDDCPTDPRSAYLENIMKKLLLTTVAAFGLATPAFAADIPAAGEPVAPAYIAPAAFNWSGPYIGVHLGYGFNGEFNDAIDGASGFVGGLQAGYNVQFDPLVVGIEAEISYTDLSETSGPIKADLNWKGTIAP